MPRKMYFSQLPRSLQTADPQLRAEILAEEGIELQSGPMPPQRAENPFMARVAKAFETYGGESPLLSQDQAAAFGKGAAKAALGAAPVLLTGGGATPMAINALASMSAGPEGGTAGGDIANAAVDTAAGALNPFLSRVPGAVRGALARGAAGAAQVGGAQMLGGKLDSAMGKPSEVEVDPMGMGIAAVLSALPPAAAGWVEGAVKKAKTAAEKSEIMQSALRMLRGAQTGPVELKTAQGAIDQALQDQPKVEQAVAGVRGKFEKAAAQYDQEMKVRDQEMKVREQNAVRVPIWQQQRQESVNPFRPPQQSPIAGPKVLPGQTRRTAEQPYDEMLTKLLDDPDGTSKMMEASINLLKEGTPKEQVDQMVKRFRDLQSIRENADRVRKTTETGKWYTRTDDPYSPRPSRSKNAPSSDPPISALPPRQVDPAVTPRPNLSIPEVEMKILGGIDAEIAKADPAGLSRLDESVKETLGEMRTKAGKGGVGAVVAGALEDPNEFQNLPRYVDALDAAFPNMNARKAVQAQIAGSMLEGFGDEAKPNMGMLQRIRGMGEDRAKVINKVFGSQDAYRNLETLHDALEAAQEAPAKGGKSWTMSANKGSLVIGVPALGAGIASYLNIPHNLGVAGYGLAAAGMAAPPTMRVITIAKDALANMIATNRSKTLDVIYDQVTGGMKYSPQTVNQVLGGLRRRASKEEDMARDEYFKEIERRNAGGVTGTFR